jgi:predicted DNA-binding WGR domain protein
VTDLFIIEGATRKYWGAAVDGGVVHTAWGRLGGVLQRKAVTLGTPPAALAEYAKLVAAKRKKGYLDARPAAGSTALLADGHEHADIVYVDPAGRLACGTCRAPVARVRVGPAPPRPPPRPEVVVAPKKQESTTALRLELERLERAAWKPLGARERSANERQARQVQDQINAIELRNFGQRTPATELEPVPGIELQRDVVWPVCASLEAGASLDAGDVASRLRASFAKSPRGERVAEIVRRESRPVLRATATTGKGSDGDRVGGVPVWIERPQWPSCEDCGDDMAFVAELAAGPSTGIGLRKGRRVYLFECAAHCFAARPHGVVVQPNDDGERRPTTKMSPSPKLGLSYEAGVELPEAGELCQDPEMEIALSLLRGDAPEIVEHETKIGGRPRWVQAPLIGPKCPACKKPFEFVAQLDARMHQRTLQHELWGDAGCFYLLMCREHERGHLEFQSS